VLDKVTCACTVVLCVGKELAYHIELMVTGEDLHGFFLTGLIVLLFHYLRVVLQDIGKPFRCQDALPEVIGLQAMGVRRIAGTVIVTLVEGQKP